MDRQEADLAGIVKDLLGAIAVVDIEIGDQDPVERQTWRWLRPRPGRHWRRCRTPSRRRAGHGAPAAGPEQRARRSLPPMTNETASMQAPAASRAARFDPGQEPGVGVEHAAARGFQFRAHLVQVFRRVDPPQLGARRLADRPAGTGLAR